MGENLNRKVIVVSAINFFEGGPLTIFKNNLKFLNNTLGDDYKVIALVHRIALFPIEELNKITFFEFPKSRKSYFLRLYFEYYYFKKLSNLWKPYLWLSLHDITPNVISDVRVVYCHNPTPFKKKSITDLFFQPIIFFFSLFYKLLYQINIKNNNYIVVQQVWLKNEFVNLFGLKKESVLVCYPETEKTVLNSDIVEINSSIKKMIFLFFSTLH